MSYTAVKTLLWAALAAALVHAGAAGISVVSVALMAGAATALLIWLVRHPAEIRQAFLARRGKGEKYLRESGRPWKKPPNPHVATVLLLLVGLVCLWATFSAPRAPDRGFLRQMLYSVLGPQGTLVLAGLSAAYFLCAAAEHALGTYWCREA